MRLDERNQWNKDPKWDEAMELLRSILDKTELVEMTKWGGPIFTIGNKNVVGLGGFRSYVGIWFYNGVFLKDELKVLVNAGEGVTKALRQWRFQSVAEIGQYEKHILAYVNEAIANERAGMAIKPEKKETIISDMFQKALDANPEMAAAFAKFSPYKQREFLEHVDSAKREETKIARLEKITPMILDNIGLHDKYR